MENLLNTPILEQLFKSKKDDFEKMLLKEKEQKERTENVANIQISILEKVKEVVKEPKDYKEIYNKMIEYELAYSNEVYEWNKNYYKLGVLDGIFLNREIILERKKENNKNEKWKECFFYKYIECFIDIIEEQKNKKLKEREDYRQELEKLESIKEKYPKLQNFIEEREVTTELSIEELKALIEATDIQNNMNAIEQEEILKLGIKEGSLL